MSEDNWKYTAVILCGVGLFKEFRPSAPFLLEYAVEHRNFTSEVVSFLFTPLHIPVRYMHYTNRGKCVMTREL